MGEKMKRFMREQSNREADEIMDMIDQDPEMADVHAPDELGAVLFAQIDEYEKSKTHNLSEEEKELIELGKVYKKRRKARKYVAVAAVAVMAMAFSGVTVMGGPEKVMEKMNWMLAGRKQTNIYSDDERIDGVGDQAEEGVYDQIQEEFGFLPVKLDYLPENMEYIEGNIYKETQYINMIYRGKQDSMIIYVMRPNYKISSIGSDIEDVLINESVEVRDEVSILIKEYMVKENDEIWFYLEFEHQNVFYYMQIFNMDDREVNEIIENLYFS